MASSWDVVVIARELTGLEGHTTNTFCQHHHCLGTEIINCPEWIFVQRPELLLTNWLSPAPVLQLSVIHTHTRAQHAHTQVFHGAEKNI